MRISPKIFAVTLYVQSALAMLSNQIVLNNVLNVDEQYIVDTKLTDNRNGHCVV